MNYHSTFTPTFSMGVNHYNISNPCRQLPKIYHEFLKQSLWYKLDVVLNPFILSYVHVRIVFHLSLILRYVNIRTGTTGTFP